jgi:hypothetical protein
MKTFTQTTEQFRKRIYEQDADAAKEQAAKNYLTKLYEFNINSITELNEEEIVEFIHVLKSLER